MSLACTLVLPPYNPTETQKLCLDCAVELAFQWSMNKKKQTYEGLNND